MNIHMNIQVGTILRCNCKGTRADSSERTRAVSRERTRAVSSERTRAVSSEGTRAVSSERTRAVSCERTRAVSCERTRVIPKLQLDFGTRPKITNRFWDFSPKITNRFWESQKTYRILAFYLFTNYARIFGTF